MAKKNGKSADLTKLNWYYLQKALYEAHGMYDKAETRQKGRERILAVYDEYARRGVVKTVCPVK